MTNVNILIQPSLTPGEFVTAVHAGNVEMLMLNTLTRIVKEFGAILEVEGMRPDYSLAVEKISELVAYGFKEESTTLLNNMGDMIAELNSELLPWFRLVAKQFNHYTIPERFSFVKEKGLFPNPDIYLEEYHEEKEIMRITFCIAGTQDNEDVIWKDAAIHIQDLIDFAVENMCESVSDNPDHHGNHVQRISSVPVRIMIEEKTAEIIKAYVKAGEDMVIL